MKTLIILVFTLLETCAFGMRCGNQLVYTGDYEYQVISKCGNPIYAGSLGVFSDLTMMAYKQEGGMTETLIFRLGRLESIDSNRN